MAIMESLQQTFATMTKSLLYIVNVDWFFASHRLPLAIYASSLDYKVNIATHFTSEKKKFLDLGFSLFNIPLSRKSSSLFDACSLLIRYIILFKRVRPDVVHLVTIKPIILGIVASFLSFTRCNIVVSITGLGYVFTATDDFAKVRRSLIIVFYRLLFLSKRIKIIVQNRDDFLFARNILSVDSSRLFLIPGSGVNLSSFNYSSLPLDSPPIILFCGRLLYSKGLVEFIESYKYVESNCIYWICGHFDEDHRDCINKDYFNFAIKQNNIRFLGALTDVTDVLKCSTIVVLPSYREGLPKSLCEAAAIGRPIITTDAPGCRDAILPNKTGLLCKIKSSRSISECIDALLQSGEQLNNMSVNARLFAEENFDLSKIVAATASLYQSK